MSFQAFIRQALVNAAPRSVRNKGSVRPIRPITPRRVSSKMTTASGIEITLYYPAGK